MTNEQKPVMIIHKEKAVFRLDKNGVWHIDDYKFTNQKIINYFHSVIKREALKIFLTSDLPQIDAITFTKTFVYLDTLNKWVEFQ